MPRLSNITVDEVKNAARISDVVKHFGRYRQDRKKVVPACPVCGQDMDIPTQQQKNFATCFHCDSSGKTSTYGPIQFVEAEKQVSFPEAVKLVAAFYGIEVREQDPEPSQRGGKGAKGAAKAKSGKASVAKANAKSKIKPQKSARPSTTFLTDQLAASALDPADLLTEVRLDDDTTVQIPRFELGTKNDDWTVNPTGTDIVIHYIGLDRKPIMVQRHRVKEDRLGRKSLGQPYGKPFPLIRIRYQFPEANLDPDGKARKYHSPPGTGIHIYLPGLLISMVERRAHIETLYIQEGEKKAECATRFGMPSTGTMGIHTLAKKDQNLSKDFETIIQHCKVKNVVFVFDADFDELGTDPEQNVQMRPRSFAAAAKNFQRHFRAFRNQGIHLNLYIAHGTDKQYKGTDDIVAARLAGKGTELKQDFEHALQDAHGRGRHVQVYDITAATTAQVDEIWHLHDKEAFADHHRERLTAMGTFVLGSQRWRMNGKGLELDEPLLPDERYWATEGKTLVFDYANAFRFLANRGFARFDLPNRSHRLVRVQQNVVHEVDHIHVRDFVMDFTKEVATKDVLNMLYRGQEMYLGPQKLSNLDKVAPEFHRNDRGVQYFYFRNVFWRITKDGIEEKPITALDGAVWAEKIIPFEAHRLAEAPLRSVKITEEAAARIQDPALRELYTGHYTLEPDPVFYKHCHFYQFIQNCSDFWHDQDEPGHTERIEHTGHILNKLTCIGYLLHKYRDPAITKAVIAMDGTLSEVDDPNGRSGKSLIGEAILQSNLRVVADVDGKKIDTDRYPWEQVDERTDIVFIDDVTKGFNFEHFFPAITGRLQVEKKGQPKFTIPPADTPKFYITTNHAIRGDGGSFRARQATMVFSDWYYEKSETDRWTPVDDFKGRFFDDWDHEQYNYFYNLMAECLRLYFLFGIVPPPGRSVELRKQRQLMGEEFLDWAETYFSLTAEGRPGPNFNTEIPKMELYNAPPSDMFRHGMSFLSMYPAQAKYTRINIFKKKLRAFCQYKGYILNPGYASKEDPQSGGDIKRGGVEYIKIIVK